MWPTTPKQSRKLPALSRQAQNGRRSVAAAPAWITRTTLAAPPVVVLDDGDDELQIAGAAECARIAESVDHHSPPGIEVAQPTAPLAPLHIQDGDELAVFGASTAADTPPICAENATQAIVELEPLMSSTHSVVSSPSSTSTSTTEAVATDLDDEGAGGEFEADWAQAHRKRQEWDELITSPKGRVQQAKTWKEDRVMSDQALSGHKSYLASLRGQQRMKLKLMQRTMDELMAIERKLASGYEDLDKMLRRGDRRTDELMAAFESVARASLYASKNRPKVARDVLDD